MKLSCHPWHKVWVLSTSSVGATSLACVHKSNYVTFGNFNIQSESLTFFTLENRIFIINQNIEMIDVSVGSQFCLQKCVK